MQAAIGLLKTLRPHQWVKNLFVLAALVFSQHLTDCPYVVRTAIALLAFCALSGAVYAFNDVRDVDADREHPTKRHRPIAAGMLSPRTALIWAVVLAAGAITAGAMLSGWLALCCAIYLVQNVAYSIKLKQVAYVDVGLIAGGFLLRVLAGAAAIAVPVSGWLLACTVLIATFLGFGKRAHELAWAERNGKSTATRAALAGYRLPQLKIAMYILAVLTVAAYTAYTLSPHTVGMFGTEKLVWSAPCVAIGIVRFLSLALWHPRDESPTEAMLRDPLFLGNGLAVIGIVLVAIYS
ncbi:MAG: UbiA prenyltransferase family protein [Kofleriaceae bacterium]